MSGLSGQVVGSSGMNEERYDHMDRKSFDSIRIEIAGAEDLLSLIHISEPTRP